MKLCVCVCVRVCACVCVRVRVGVRARVRKVIEGETELCHANQSVYFSNVTCTSL